MLFIFFGVLYVFGGVVRSDIIDKKVWLTQGINNDY